MKTFIKILGQEAINCQAYAFCKASDAFTPKKRTKEANVSAPKAKQGKPKPVCSYLPHKENGLRHYLKDCRDCPKEQKENLFEELGAQKDGGMKRTTDPTSDTTGSSVLFTATLDGKLRTTVCADIGSAATLMDANTLAKVQIAGVDATVVKLDPLK